MDKYKNRKPKFAMAFAFKFIRLFTMRLLLVLVCIFSTFFSFSQDSKKLLKFNKVAIPGYKFEVFIENPTDHVMSYLVNFETKHYKADKPLEIKDTIAPHTRKRIIKFKRSSRKQGRFIKYDWEEHIGNVFTRHELNFKYFLPYAQGSHYKVIQAYDEGETHSNLEAIDFAMPVNTIVMAARSGLVIEVEQDYVTGCPEDECAGKANYVRILHYDGTFGLYKHFRHHGVEVNVGEYVNIGDMLGFSGATGQVSEPQLHFQLEKLHPNMRYHVTIPMKFIIDNRGRAKILEVGDDFVRPNNFQ